MNEETEQTVPLILTNAELAKENTLLSKDLYYLNRYALRLEGFLASTETKLEMIEGFLTVCLKNLSEESPSLRCAIEDLDRLVASLKLEILTGVDSEIRTRTKESYKELKRE